MSVGAPSRACFRSLTGSSFFAATFSIPLPHTIALMHAAWPRVSRTLWHSGQLAPALRSVVNSLGYFLPAREPQALSVALRCCLRLLVGHANLSAAATGCPRRALAAVGTHTADALRAWLAQNHNALGCHRDFHAARHYLHAIQTRCFPHADVSWNAKPRFRRHGL